MIQDRFVDILLRYHRRYVILWCIVLMTNLFMLLYMSVYFLENLFFIPGSIEISAVIFILVYIALLCILIILAVYDRRVIYKKQIAMQSEVLLRQIEQNQIHQLQLHEKTLLAQKEELEFEKHIGIIAELLKEERNVELSEYITALRQVVPVNEIYRFTGRIIIDLMFSEKMKLAQDKQICLEIDYSSDARIHWLSEYDISLLLSNLLDNALASAENSKEKMVSCIVCRKYMYMDLIVIQNSCDIEPRMHKNIPISSAAEEEHGHGMKIIQRKVKCFKGNLLYEYDSKNRKISAFVLLPIQSKNSNM